MAKQQPPTVGIADAQIQPPQFGGMTAEQVNTLAGRAALLEAYGNGLEKAFEQHEQQVAALRERVAELEAELAAARKAARAAARRTDPAEQAA